MTIRSVLAVLLFTGTSLLAARKTPFTLEQILSAPFPSDLRAAPKTGAVAWVLNERGARNIWIAEPPDYRGRRVTDYHNDDGQEIAQVTWTPDGNSLLFVRGGDFDMQRENPNPQGSIEGADQDIWIVPLQGGAPRKVAEGNSPAVSPKGDQVAFLKKGEIWSIGFDPNANPAQLIHARGKAAELQWSPDGSRLAFTISRDDHAFIAVYSRDQDKLVYLAPSVDTDSSPTWSPDGTQIAYVRIPASTGVLPFVPLRTAQPWSIQIADAASGKGRQLWRASEGPGSAFHNISADHQLFWAADDRIIFPWEKTGWTHLYSISTHGDRPTALNSDGDFEVENVSLTADRHSVLFSSNQDDIDRRHIWRVSVTGEGVTRLTTGEGIEWSPAQTSDGRAIVVLHSDAKNPARAAIQPPNEPLRDLAPDALPSDFPASALIAPEQVLLTAADGMRIHGQLFLPADNGKRKPHPAVVFMHGGSRRQMLLGWHYMFYYHNAYAMNQYLASLGIVVLSLNYRSGIGYGLDFREALQYGAAGASEFNDVLGAGLYLRTRPDVDPNRIGLWGGSYGGFLTALGLARASDLFAAGVDFHGVHDWNKVIGNFESSYDPAKNEAFARLAYESSPMASVSAWRSPVLLIHGDDDRNVPFHETVVLTEALRKQHVPVEELTFPDEVHDFLTQRRWLEAYHAAADFLTSHLAEQNQ